MTDRTKQKRDVLDQTHAMTQQDRQEIKNLIEEAEKRIKGKRLSEWLKESLALAIVLGGASFIVHEYIPAQIGSQTSGMASDVAVLKSDLSSIKTDVAALRKEIQEQLTKALDSARQQLQQQKGLGPRSAIGFGNQILNMARTLNVELPSDSLEQYRNALAQNRSPQDPLYWLSAATVIQQRTNANQSPLPNCLDSPPRTTLANSIAPGETTAVLSHPFGWEMCRVALEDLGSSQAYLSTLATYGVVQFKDSTIIYDGGPLAFPATGNSPTFSLIFDNCHFVFTPSGVPPRNGQTLIADVLAARTLGNVTVTLPRG
jgi:hypothetical protein